MQTSPLVAAAHRIACLPAADTDLHVLLAELCADVRSAVRVEAVVFMSVEPGSAVGSSGPAQLLADLQQQARRGPVFEAVATGRPVYTPELGRVAPVDLAMAAMESQLTNSVALPMQSRGRAVGAVQLLQGREQALGGWQVGALRPLLDVLGARLVDLRLLSRLRAGDVPRRARPGMPARPGSPSPATTGSPARGGGPEVTTAIPVRRHAELPADRPSARHSVPSQHSRGGVAYERPTNGVVSEPHLP